MLSSLLQVVHIGVLGFLLSLVLASANHKLRAPGQFRRALVGYEMLPGNLALTLAGIVPFVEISVISVAVIAFALQATAVTTLLLGGLLLTYAAFLGFAMLTGRSLADCGCSLNGGEASVKPAILVMRNLALLALVAVFHLTQQASTGTLSEWLMGITFSLLLFITYSSIDGLLENHALLKNLRLRHD